MRLAVIGTGYVGLVAGAGFAEFGNHVICVDSDAEKVAGLLRGELHFHEPGLRELVLRNVGQKRLEFDTDLKRAVEHAEVIFIAVGTPQSANGSADISQVMTVAEQLGEIADGKIVVVKSTVPVGTGNMISLVFAEKSCSALIVSNPEFLKEGDALNDFMKPARIIIGTSSAYPADVLKSLYAPFVKTNDRILVMSRRTAELTKYAANAFLATRISFINDIANLCETVGADVEDVRKGMCSDPRIGLHAMFPGSGYGGSCFPKDVRALMFTGESNGSPQRILQAVDEINERQKTRIADKIAARFASSGGLKGKRIAIWGLAFKPGTDDVREAPALKTIEMLLSMDAIVCVYDPIATQSARKVLENSALYYRDDPYIAATGADAVALMTEWPQFRRPDLGKLHALMRSHHLFDGRNIWDPAEVTAAGFTYDGIGRTVH